MPKTVREIHDKYGDFVRIGPNELSIRSPEAVEAILASRGRINKGPWCVLSRRFLRSSKADCIESCNRYDAMCADKGDRSVHAMKAVEAHTQMSKYWDNAVLGMPPMLRSFNDLRLLTGLVFHDLQ